MGKNCFLLALAIWAIGAARAASSLAKAQNISSVNLLGSAHFPEVGRPKTVALSRNATLVAIANEAGELYLGDPRTPPLVEYGKLPGGEMHFAFSPTDHVLAVIAGPELHLLGTDATKATGHWRDLVAPILSPHGSFSSVRFSGSGNLIVCGTEAGSILIVNPRSGEQVSSFPVSGKDKIPALTRRVAFAAFDASAQGLVVIGADMYLRHLRASDGAILDEPHALPEQLPGYKEKDMTGIRDVDATPDASVIAVGASCVYAPGNFFNTLVKVIDPNGKTLTVLSSHVQNTEKGFDTGISVTPDGRFVMSGNMPGLMIWPTHGGLGLPVQTPAADGLVASAASDFDADAIAFVSAGRTASLETVRRDGPSLLTTETTTNGIDFDFPNDPQPYVFSDSAEISVSIRGASSNARARIDLQGLTPVAGSDGANRVAGGAAAISSGDGREGTATEWRAGVLHASRIVSLQPGENRVTVTLSDEGHNDVSAAKTLCFVPKGVAETDIYKTSRALIIGIDNYNAKIGALHCAVADAEAVTKILVGKYGFLPQNVVNLRNTEATRANIIAELNKLRDNNLVGRQDRVLVFFAGHGHGVQNPQGKRVGFIIPQDANINLSDLENFGKLRSECVDMQDFADVAGESPAQHVVVLMDACFSGISTSGDQSSQPETESGWKSETLWRSAREIITASSDDEMSQEGVQIAKEGAKHGFFTQALLESLDSRSTSFLTADLFADLRKRVQQLNKQQHPTFGRLSDSPGDLLWIPDSANKPKTSSEGDRRNP